jgi:O-antigen/teichoic acid export membrane protein
MICQFFVLACIGRQYAAENTAAFFSLINYFSFAILLLGISLESTLIYHVGKSKQLLPILFKLASKWAIAVFLILFLLVQFIPNTLFTSAQLTQACFYITGMLLFTYFSSLFACMQQFIYTSAVSIVFNAAIILVAISYKSSFIQFKNIYFLLVLLQGVCIWILFAIKNRLVLSTKASAQLNNTAIIKYALWACICNIAYQLLYRSDYIFIEKIIKNPYELGNYIQASKIAQMAILVPAFVSNSLFIFYSNKDKPFNKQTLNKSIMVNMLIAFIVCIPFLILGNYLFTLFFGKSFNLASHYFALLVPGVVALAGLTPIAAYWASKNKQWINYYTTFAGFLVVAVLNVIFLKKMGVSFAAVSSSISYTVVFLLLYLKLKYSSE